MIISVYRYNVNRMAQFSMVCLLYTSELVIQGPQVNGSVVPGDGNVLHPHQVIALVPGAAQFFYGVGVEMCIRDRAGKALARSTACSQASASWDAVW